MIILFHSLSFLLKRLVDNYRIAKAIEHFQNIDLTPHVTIHSRCRVTDALDLRFEPPVFIQRYITVHQILLNPNWKLNIKKVVVLDRELNFFSYIKYLYHIQEIIYVDMDEDCLKSKLGTLTACQDDYRRPRPNRLKIQALSGSPSQPDERLAGCDAFIAIEMIQKLYPDTLEGLPYNVFHYIQPLLAIFTVPNAEFDMPTPSRRRNRYDTHKFEWTRDRFESWALNITARFPNYTVRFRGIAEGPELMEAFGCATQAAIFFRHSERKQPISKSWDDDNESYGICTYYNYVKQSEKFFNVTLGANCYYKELRCDEYPYKIDNRTPDERLVCHVEDRLYLSPPGRSQHYNEITGKVEYPLYRLVKNEMAVAITTVSELSKILKKNGYKVEDRDDYYVGPNCPCLIYSPKVEIKKVEDKDSSSDEPNLELECGQEDYEAEENVEDYETEGIGDYEIKESAEEFETFKTEEEAEGFETEEEAKILEHEGEAKSLETEEKTKVFEAEEEAKHLKSEEKVQDFEAKVETEDIETGKETEDIEAK